MSENTIKFIKVMLVANLLVSALLVVFFFVVFSRLQAAEDHADRRYIDTIYKIRNN